MFNTECKKTVSKIILSFILIMMTLLSGCQKNTTHSAIEFGTIDVSEIDKIELSGTTGGKDGNFSYTLSDQEKKEFVHLLNQVELGDEVDKNQALSSGAVTYYKLYFQGKDVVTLCPGHYFGVDEKYYEFVNFEELWDEFITFNSKQDTSQQDKWDCSVTCAETSETNNYVVTYSDKKYPPKLEYSPFKTAIISILLFIYKYRMKKKEQQKFQRAVLVPCIRYPKTRHVL